MTFPHQHTPSGLSEPGRGRVSTLDTSGCDPPPLLLVLEVAATASPDVGGGGTKGEVEEARDVTAEVGVEAREVRRGLLTCARSEVAGREGGGKGHTGRKGRSPGNCA